MEKHIQTDLQLKTVKLTSWLTVELTVPMEGLEETRVPLPSEKGNHWKHYRVVTIGIVVTSKVPQSRKLGHIIQ